MIIHLNEELVHRGFAEWITSETEECEGAVGGLTA